MQLTVSVLERKIIRIKKRIAFLKKEHGNTPTENFNYYGGWDLGYWEGRLSALEDVLDELHALADSQNSTEQPSENIL